LVSDTMTPNIMTLSITIRDQFNVVNMISVVRLGDDKLKIFDKF
jgi:hypothetical protein